MININGLIKNRSLLAIIIGVAVIATVGGLSAVSAVASGNQAQTPQAPQIQGSINLGQLIQSNVQTKFSTAADTAASAVTNGKVIGGSLTVIQGSVVYSFRVIDDKNLVYSVVVDPANGKILYTSQGHAMYFGGIGMRHFGMGHHGKGNFRMNQHMWNSTQTPSGNTNPSNGYTTPTYGNQNL
jgi:uncharacterized membrane protein YkoI